MDPRAILSSNKIFIDYQIQVRVYIFGDILLVYAEIQTRVVSCVKDGSSELKCCFPSESDWRHSIF